MSIAPHAKVDEKAQATTCTYCGGKATLPVWNDESAGEFLLRRCPQCQLVVTHPRPNDLAPYYAEQYYGRRNVRFIGPLERLVRRFASGRARHITRSHAPNPPGRVLDVGCGRGVLLADLRELGWEPHGVELSEHSAQFAREELGLDVTASGFRPQDFPPNHFDAVIFWHVLEHLVDVRSALEGAMQILRPGGLLVIAVPNFASWQAQWTGYSCFHLDMPRHVSHFEVDWLVRHLEDLGADLLRVDHGSLEQNVYGWIQSLLNKTGIRRNLLYDLLKNRSAQSQSAPLRKHPIGSMLSLAGLGVLLPFALLMNVGERLLARGATIDLFVRKRSDA